MNFDEELAAFEELCVEVTTGVADVFKGVRKVDECVQKRCASSAGLSASGDAKRARVREAADTDLSRVKRLLEAAEFAAAESQAACATLEQSLNAKTSLLEVSQQRCAALDSKNRQQAAQLEQANRELHELSTPSATDAQASEAVLCENSMLRLQLDDLKRKNRELKRELKSRVKMCAADAENTPPVTTEPVRNPRALQAVSINSPRGGNDRDACNAAMSKSQAMHAQAMSGVPSASLPHFPTPSSQALSPTR
eukprot:Rhum_TRINITY_DN7981_c0_g1::Rhum_TRINITY_DN7981_c0_g1_i1::g.25505::m.25505